MTIEMAADTVLKMSREDRVEGFCDVVEQLSEAGFYMGRAQLELLAQMSGFGIAVLKQGEWIVRTLWNLEFYAESNKAGLANFNPESVEVFIKEGYEDTYEVYTWQLLPLEERV